MSRPLHILLLEDELPAARKALAYLNRFSPSATITHLRSLQRTRDWLAGAPLLDLIVSDIELLDGSAFELFRAEPPGVPMLFLTAYPNFRAEAFETDGIAYLVKPYGEEEFAAAWAKYRRLAALAVRESSVGSPPLLLKSKLGDTVRLVPVDAVAYFQSQGDFTLAIDQEGHRFPLSETLTQLEEQLDAAAFFRLGRSEMVAREAVASYRPFRKNRLAIVLKAPVTVELYTSNRLGPAFKRWFANPSLLLTDS